MTTKRLLRSLVPPQLAGMAWAVARVQYQDEPWLHALSAVAIERLTAAAEGRAFESSLWALSRAEDLGLAWALFTAVVERPVRPPRPGAHLGAGALLAEVELRGCLEGELRVLRGLETALGAAATLALGLRIAVAGRAPEAAVVLGPLAAGPLANPAVRSLAACGAEASAPRGLPYHAPTPWLAAKELRVLASVAQNAVPGDAASVCAAVERFGLEVLVPEGQWLKVAAGAKANVLRRALQRAPPGHALEVGTYCGYSALRLALELPQPFRVVSLEAVSAHALVARCLVALAGQAHRIDILTGHSEDTLHRLHQRPGIGAGLRFGLVFMDQRGSRYAADLRRLRELGVLLPGAVAVADNVLKPGAPLFLWELFRGPCYSAAEVVSVPEFGMPGVEDWMAVAGVAVGGAPWAAAPPAPEELHHLEREAEAARLQAAGAPGGVSFGAWRALARRMRAGLARAGIRPGAPAGAAP